jgi:hypothetical protein
MTREDEKRKGESESSNFQVDLECGRDLLLHGFHKALERLPDFLLHHTHNTHATLSVQYRGATELPFALSFSGSNPCDNTL